jgi:hypothetical protein
MARQQTEQQQLMTTPYSSPISQNPLLRGQVHTPSPLQWRVASFRTRDSNEAWAAAEGLFPIQDGFKAPGYAPAQVVGGITYSIPSPPRTVSRAIRGQQLFTDAALHLQGAPSLLLWDADDAHMQVQGTPSLPLQNADDAHIRGASSLLLQNTGDVHI